MYTTYANYNTEKANRGYLKKGFIADFSIFKHDLMSMNKIQFHKDIVLMTVVDEKIVYQKT
jgi:predicted amidohydrolase YtcJ